MSSSTNDDCYDDKSARRGGRPSSSGSISDGNDNVEGGDEERGGESDGVLAPVAAEAPASSSLLGDNNIDTDNDSEEEEQGGVTASSPAPAIQQDPQHMKLSDEEHEWAMEVKQAVLKNEDLLPLTDFEYVLYAINYQGNLEQALWSIQRMQDFYQNYNLRLTVQEGLECIVGLIEQQPGFLLHIDIDPTNQASVNVIDIGVFDPSKSLDDGGGSSSRETKWRTYITGIHYVKWCSQPTFATIRAGFYALADCGDVQGATNFQLEKLQIRMFHELFQCYPFHWKSFMAFNTGFFANIMMSVMKTVMNENMHKSIQVGCQIEDAVSGEVEIDRLRDFYLQPNFEEAYQRMITKAHELLEQRVHNMKTFRL